MEQKYINGGIWLYLVHVLTGYYKDFILLRHPYLCFIYTGCRKWDCYKNPETKAVQWLFLGPD